jgi:hypothetical protein
MSHRVTVPKPSARGLLNPDKGYTKIFRIVVFVKCIVIACRNTTSALHRCIQTADATVYNDANCNRLIGYVQRAGLLHGLESVSSVPNIPRQGLTITRKRIKEAETMLQFQ